MIFALLTGGCATLERGIPPDVQPVAPPLSPSEEGWWRTRFRMDWPEDMEPAWHVDLFLAHGVISPVLEQHKDAIKVWRFHRRAVRDHAGHQFSFIFYCNPIVAEEIYGAIQSDNDLEQMKSNGVILEEIYDDASSIAKPNIEDTSDPNWSPAIRKAWPYFIMGVSQMWLNLVSEVAEESPVGERPSTIEEIEGFYRRVNEVITESWQEEGGHALLHHLNAIFGYEPVGIYEKRYMRF